MLESFYIFLAIVGPVLFFWLSFGPKLLLVKTVWIVAGALLILTGTMMIGSGWVSGIGGIFFLFWELL